MPGLLSILRKRRRREREVRILVLGTDNAGKTTCVRRWKHEAIDDIAATLGFQIVTLTRDRLIVHLWDVGGQQSLRLYWRNYFEETDGIVWVVDSADTDRMQDGASELGAVLANEPLGTASLLVLANKQDLEGALPPAELSTLLALQSKVGATRHWRIQGCSAATGEGLAEGLDWLLADIEARLYQLG